MSELDSKRRTDSDNGDRGAGDTAVEQEFSNHKHDR